MLAIGDYERMGDHATYILKIAEKLKDSEKKLSQTAVDELKVIVHAVSEIFLMSFEAYKTDNVQYDPNESFIGKLSDMLKKRGIKTNSPNEAGNGVYLIAEPWTCGGKNSYQIGKFPSPWAQWNDVARETIRKVVYRYTWKHI